MMELDELKKMTIGQLRSLYKERTKVPVIRSLNQRLGYLEARKVAGPYGGLPRNPLTTQLLVYQNGNGIPSDYLPAWQRELLVHPAPGEVFKKGEDITEKDGTGRKWVYPSYCIPEEARKSNTALFVDPKREPVVEGNEVIVTADPYKEVTILEDFPQESGWGKTDKATGIPLAYRKVDDLPFEEKGYLWRSGAEGLRPLVRGYVGRYVDGRQGVVADYGPDGGFGVGVESREAASQVSPSRLTLGELLKALQKQ